MRYKSAPANIKYAPHIRPVHIAVIALLLVVASGIGLYLAHTKAEEQRAREAKRTALQATVQALQMAWDEVAQTQVDEKHLDTDTMKAWQLAQDAIKRRHENAISDNPSFEVNYAEAKTEAHYVDRMQDDDHRMEAPVSRFVAAMTTALGADATQRYVNDLQIIRSADSVGLADWAHAAHKIMDVDKFAVRDGGSDDSTADQTTIDHLYEERDEELARANGAIGTIDSDRKDLITKLITKLRDAKAELKAT